mgnify:CR=1 FL=1
MKDYRDVIVRPVVMAEENKYTFEVAKGTNKIEIRQAVEAIWKVKVEAVNTVNVKPKTKRVGRYTGKTSAVHKAIVKVQDGQTIDLFGEAE